MWALDLGGATLTRVTAGAGNEHSPVWTADGQRLIFMSERDGLRNLYWQAANTTSTVERLTESSQPADASGVSPDGRLLIFTEAFETTAEDIMQLALAAPYRATPLVQSPFSERNGVVSPDGRWLAYEANDSGRFEISVRPFPSGEQRALAGVRWRRDPSALDAKRSGIDLRRADRRADERTRGGWPVVGGQRTAPVVKEGYLTMPQIDLGRTYDVGSDGRFLMVKGGGTEPTATPAALVVVQHWGEELKRLVPTPD